MFEIHTAADGIEMACSLKCLTLFGEFDSPKNGEQVSDSNGSSAVTGKMLSTNAVADPPIERVPRFVPMAELLSTMQPILVICVELLHNILVHKRIGTDIKDDKKSGCAVVAHKISQQSDDDGTANASLERHHGKRLYEDVDRDTSQLDDDLAKRVKEEENGEILLNAVVHDDPISEAIFDEDDIPNMSPRTLALHSDIEDPDFSFSWDAYHELSNESIYSFRLTEDTESLDIPSTENRE